MPLYRLPPRRKKHLRQGRGHASPLRRSDWFHLLYLASFAVILLRNCSLFLSDSGRALIEPQGRPWRKHDEEPRDQRERSFVSLAPPPCRVVGRSFRTEGARGRGPGLIWGLKSVCRRETSSRFRRSKVRYDCTDDRVNCGLYSSICTDQHQLRLIAWGVHVQSRRSVFYGQVCECSREVEIRNRREALRL